MLPAELLQKVEEDPRMRKEKHPSPRSIVPDNGTQGAAAVAGPRQARSAMSYIEPMFSPDTLAAAREHGQTDA